MRRVVVVVATAAVLLVGTHAALAHSMSRFDSCVGNRHFNVVCRDRYLVLPGDRVWHARAKPSHSGQTVRIWRRNPDADWVKVANKQRLGPRGWLHWSWQTEARHVADVAYRFRVVLPGHGKSDTVRIPVVEPH
jgi:hypothetical protein